MCLEYFEQPLDDDWEIDRNQIAIKEQLGEGAFGLVMKGEATALTDMPNRCTVALKMLKGQYDQVQSSPFKLYCK